MLVALHVIDPGGLWFDDRQRHIQAHGGGILKVRDTYYWFGEDRAADNAPGKRYVSCYSSKDLINWKFRHTQGFEPLDGMGEGFVLERPKVFHNPKTGRYVMYFHLDSRDYKAARVGIAVSDRVDGDYRFLRSFRPFGQQSRDIGQFVDDDGTAYLVFEDRANGFHIAKLSDDYLDVAEDTCLIRAPLEGGAIVHYNGLYYAIGSALTGWDPNSNKYATATSLKGPWSEFRDIAPPATRTYGSQSTLLLKIVGSKTTSVIFMGDQWRPRTQWNSRYLWMPVEIGDGKLWLPSPHPWTIDVRTGETRLVKD
jgi:hypothetical protein